MIISIASPFFLTGDNLSNVAVQVAPLAKLRGKPVEQTVDTGAKLITPENARDHFEEVRGKLGGTGRGIDG